ncbi:MAG: hypothetical protein IJU78_03215 [Clostridia bacterium]|nr:hypothetical protein [Clostridia bacterium]
MAKKRRSEPDIFRGFMHYDSKGSRLDGGEPGAFGTYARTDGDGCYIATCVCGSEGAEVWTLRRFREEVMGVPISGELYIRAYYSLVPAIVRLFGRYRRLRAIWHKRHAPRKNAEKTVIGEKIIWQDRLCKS